MAYKCYIHAVRVAGCKSCDKEHGDLTLKLPDGGLYGLPGVTRVELLQEGSMVDTIIDTRDRTGGIEVSLSLQDDGRTLKVFVRRREGS